MAITKISPDLVDFDSALVVSPTLTIGDATAQDTKIVFDGNAQDYYIGLDDSADDLVIGLGSAVGTTPAISIDENLKSTLVGQVVIDPADGVADEAYALFVRNNEATDGRNYGLVVRAGSTSADESFSVRDHANASTYFKVRGDGNIGINTASPLMKAHIKGATGDVPSNDSNPPANGIAIFDSGGGYSLVIGTDDSNTGSAWIQSQSANVSSSEYDLLLNPNGGLVGIGTTNAYDRLHISRTSTSQTAGITLENLQPGGYGTGITWESKRSDSSAVQTAGRISVQGYNSWNSDATASSRMIVQLRHGNTLSDVISIHNGNLRFEQTGKGIDFSVNSNATGSSSEVLDDYEEGTFTPFITTSGGNFTSGSQDPYGYYTKIGRVVHIELEVSISSSTTISGGSGDFRITGIPFDPVIAAVGDCSTGRVDPPTIGTWQAYQPAGQYYLNLRAIESGGDGIEVAGPGIITGNTTPWFSINLIYTV
jgi:hypothetical protein